MTETADTTKAQLQQLACELDKVLPHACRATITPLLAGVAQRSIRHAMVLDAVSLTLQDLRLDMKYLMFDLEATRRERDELRQRYQPE